MGATIEIITLRGKTRKGKNRIAENGAQWAVIKSVDRVLFSKEPGPWLLIAECLNNSGIRWIHKVHDPDFEIVSCTSTVQAI